MTIGEQVGLFVLVQILMLIIVGMIFGFAGIDDENITKRGWVFLAILFPLITIPVGILKFLKWFFIKDDLY